jgi:hypothetical protein
MVAGFCKFACIDLQDRHLAKRRSQITLELGNGRVGVDPPPQNLARLFVRSQCFGRLAGGAEQKSDVFVAGCQSALELANRRFGVDQPLRSGRHVRVGFLEY